jgi:Lantibiotic modifying enzyme
MNAQDNDIKNLLKNIFIELKDSNLTHPSLLAGRSGIELFNFNYLQYQVKNNEISPEINFNIDTLIENSIGNISSAFCDGKSGINFFFAYLSKCGILSDEDKDYLCDDDSYLKETSLNMLKVGSYDFLYGALGIAHYILYTKPQKDSQNYFSKCFELLELLSAKSLFKVVVPYFEVQSYKILPEKVNLGIAHGIPAVLKFYLECYKLDILKTKAKQSAYRVINFILGQIRVNAVSCFPNVITYNSNEKDDSRLAWCYGDLSIALLMFQAGKLFHDQELENLSLEIMVFNSKRLDDQNTLIRDAGLCHGSAGVAHIFNKMYSYTNIPEFKEAFDVWVKETIRFSTFNDSLSGYRRFDPLTNTFIKDDCLLTGTAGIGLALLSSLTKDFSWDYCLMLND